MDALSPQPTLFPLVEVGWVVVEPIDAVDREAAEHARNRLQAWFEREMTDFSWSFQHSSRSDLFAEPRAWPMNLIDIGALERDAKGWDFTIVITGAALCGFGHRYLLAATSRCEATATISTLRLDPAESRRTPSDRERSERLEDRITLLCLRCLVLLSGLEPTALGLKPFSLEGCRIESDTQQLNAYGRKALRDKLTRVADPRVEEQAIQSGRTDFYFRAVRADPWAIPSMIWGARPWLLPFRLGRMMSAALSILLLVTLTEEAWRVGATRSPAQIGFVVVVALLGTVALVVGQQGLLRRNHLQLTEQIALSNIATFVAISLGFLASFVCLFAVSLSLSAFVLDDISRLWVGMKELGLEQRLYFSSFSASIGVVAGALGASFEESEDFRHIARVDREL